MHLGRILVLASLATVAGCHSAYVDATVKNGTAQAVTLVEVDYPSASFGTQTLLPGETFHYRFKILGDGPTKLLWTDAQRKERHSDGPALREGQEGQLAITLGAAAVDWQNHLTTP